MTARSTSHPVRSSSASHWPTCSRVLTVLPADNVRKYLSYSVGYNTLYLCNSVSVVEPAALVATVLLTHHQRGISRKALVHDVLWLRNEILARGGNVRAARTLGPSRMARVEASPHCAVAVVSRWR